MGYYSNFEVSIFKKEQDVPDLLFDEVILEKYFYNGMLEVNYDSNTISGNTKWYDCEEDMRLFSKVYPQYVFLVEVEGEIGGDLWKAYFKAGKEQRVIAKIVYDEYDESKLE